MTTQQQFLAFWQSYPNKKGRGDAEKAFKAAIKIVTLDELLAAITKYVANKPDWQAFKYPASWLRGQHWHDEWEPAQSKAPALKTSADRFQSREEYIAYHVKKNAPEPVNDDMKQRLRSAGIGV